MFNTYHDSICSSWIGGCQCTCLVQEQVSFLALDPVTSTSSDKHAFFSVSSRRVLIFPPVARGHKLCPWTKFGWSACTWLSMTSCSRAVASFCRGCLAPHPHFQYHGFLHQCSLHAGTSRDLRKNLQSALRYATHKAGIISHQLCFLHV